MCLHWHLLHRHLLHWYMLHWHVMPLYNCVIDQRLALFQVLLHIVFHSLKHIEVMQLSDELLWPGMYALPGRPLYHHKNITDAAILC